MLHVLAFGAAPTTTTSVHSIPAEMVVASAMAGSRNFRNLMTLYSYHMYVYEQGLLPKGGCKIGNGVRLRSFEEVLPDAG